MTIVKALHAGLDTFEVIHPVSISAARCRVVCNAGNMKRGGGRGLEFQIQCTLVIPPASVHGRHGGIAKMALQRIVYIMYMYVYYDVCIV